MRVVAGHRNGIRNWIEVGDSSKVGPKAATIRAKSLAQRSTFWTSTPKGDRYLARRLRYALRCWTVLVMVATVPVFATRSIQVRTLFLKNSSSSVSGRSIAEEE